MLVLIDNYDSFTFNLAQGFRDLGGDIEIVRNDEMTPDAVLERSPQALVLSPGPGRPEDAGLCLPLVRRRPDVPLLGVCLGHQVLAVAAGATVVSSPEPRHGKTSRVEHSGAGVFAGLPSPMTAMRYHSLMVDARTLPSAWEAVAWSDDGVLMGLRHLERPWWGIQFHPESVLSPEGPLLLRNFLSQAGVTE